MKGSAGERKVGQSFTSAELAARLNCQAELLRIAGGGVTFSGGEALMQAEFVAETISQLERLHVTLDTSGYASQKDFRRVVGCCDYVLFDLKLADPHAHRRWTGVDNALILQNLCILAAMDIPFLVRIPLVPGVTDTDENLSGIAEIVHHLPRSVRVELLPFNSGARSKYAACNMLWRPGFDETAKTGPNLKWFSDLEIEAALL